jgi:integrase
MRLHCLLYGDVAAESAQSERLQAWNDAFNAWLAQCSRRFTPRVAKDACAVWAEFLGFIQKPPWEVEAEHVIAYVESLILKGFRPATISKRLTALRKFYGYCQKAGTDSQCGDGFNPVVGVRHPRVIRNERSNYLSQEEEAVLLEAIRRDPSPTGKRDYALFLLILSTGWSAGVARRLKWGEISQSGDGVCSIPEEVIQAIQIYLKASGRWGVIQPQEYVFAPSRQPLVREAGAHTDDWAGDRALSVYTFQHLIKLYAGWAGLKGEAITCHTLRHTAAIRCAEAAVMPACGGSAAGDPVDAVQTFLRRADRSNTRAYLKMLAAQPVGGLRRRRRLQRKIPSRGPWRFKSDHHINLRHGARAKQLPELEWLEQHGMRLEGIERLVASNRIVAARSLVLSWETNSVKELLGLLDAAGQAVLRAERLLKVNEWKEVYGSEIKNGQASARDQRVETRILCQILPPGGAGGPGEFQGSGSRRRDPVATGDDAPCPGSPGRMLGPAGLDRCVGSVEPGG